MNFLSESHKVPSLDQSCSLCIFLQFVILLNVTIYHITRMQMMPSFTYLFVLRIMRVWQLRNLLWNCVNDIKIWMQSHILKLNDDKTELLLVHSKYRQMPALLPVLVGKEMTMPTEYARNIGVTLDQQVTSVCESAFFSSNIRKIRKYISQHNSEIILHSLVTSRLLNCNALLCGVLNVFSLQDFNASRIVQHAW